ncbi:hypothetical protein B0H10DRAFT_1819773 [Mycena sp. CBHHK59/15]|nr:hypothetical protein B0H10DRAFT_1819773 [Mycena sp. CBHHK59/15]
MARDYLAIQGSVTPDKWVFSSGSLTGTKLRNSLSTDLFEALHLLKVHITMATLVRVPSQRGILTPSSRSSMRTLGIQLRMTPTRRRTRPPSNYLQNIFVAHYFGKIQ